MFQDRPWGMCTVRNCSLAPLQHHRWLVGDAGCALFWNPQQSTSSSPGLGGDCCPCCLIVVVIVDESHHSRVVCKTWWRGWSWMKMCSRGSAEWRRGGSAHLLGGGGGRGCQPLTVTVADWFNYSLTERNRKNKQTTVCINWTDRQVLAERRILFSRGAQLHRQMFPS